MEIKSEANSGLITRDFLGGGCFGVESKELDLDLRVPTGWEKRLDLKVIFQFPPLFFVLFFNFHLKFQIMGSFEHKYVICFYFELFNVN